jgi:predicted MFS family arabinose efflux permease
MTTAAKYAGASAQHQADAAAKRLALRLAVASALAGGNAAVLFATASIIGASMAPSPGLATAPLSIYVVGMAFGTLPIGAIARRWGRKAAFLAGAFAGVLTGIISAFSTLLWSFPMLCTGAFFAGVYAAASQSYRFAATDGASPYLQPKVIAWVMTGGVAASFVGPQLVQHTMDLWPQHLFTATYFGQAGVAVLAMLVLAGVKPPPPAAVASDEPVRPLIEIVSQPKFIVAALCGTVSYGLMNFVMTAAPLAMKMCGLSLTDSNLGLQWHILGMYAPSFFTGGLIQRFGVSRVITFGIVLEALAGVVDLSGLTVGHFWAGLVLLGLGWNFSFIGASALVVQCHRPSERTKVQSFNDFVVFGTIAAGSFFSGQLLAGGGWSVVNYAVFPPALVAMAALLWLSTRRDKAGFGERPVAASEKA